MLDGQFDYYFVVVLLLFMGVIGGFVVEQFDVDFVVGFLVVFGEDFFGFGDDCLVDLFGFFQCIDVGDQVIGGVVEIVWIGGVDFVLVGGWQVVCVFYCDLVGFDLVQVYFGEVVDYVGQQVGVWVVDFVEYLFVDVQFVDQVIGVGCFGYYEVFVGFDFDDGEIDVFIVWYLFLVGEIVVGVLCVVFDDVFGEGCLGQLVVVVLGLVEFVYQGGVDYCVVDYLVGDYDICVQVQGFDDVWCVEVGVE